MKHSCTSRKTTESFDADKSLNSTGFLSRRRFITFLTAGATSLAVQACGGGGGEAPAAAPAAPAPTPTTPTTPAAPVTTAPPPTTAPVTPTPTLAWSTVPTLVFTQGVVSSISVAQWLSGTGGATLALSLNSVPLPAGVTYNSATQSFDYDGVGAVASTDGHVLTASGG